MKMRKPSPAPKRRIRRRKLQLLIMTIAIIGVTLVGAIYAWDYRPPTLADETTSITESYVRQLNIDTSFGSTNVNITVETCQIPVRAIIRWQQGTTNARILS